MFQTAVKRRRPVRPNMGTISKFLKVSGNFKGKIPDALSWLTCAACQVRVGNVSGLPSTMVIGDMVDVSFICRHCKCEQAQSDIIERLVREVRH